jgi:hypothetical protein
MQLAAAEASEARGDAPGATGVRIGHGRARRFLAVRWKAVAIILGVIVIGVGGLVVARAMLAEPAPIVTCLSTPSQPSWHAPGGIPAGADLS